ncbi:MAG: LCP family protein [Candidatus Woesebacteria bacterium]|jgi:anionic cell wall polymer biosynthesis LytR-Cps2A-Psr (LCP) family protein
MKLPDFTLKEKLLVALLTPVFLLFSFFSTIYTLDYFNTDTTEDNQEAKTPIEFDPEPVTDEYSNFLLLGYGGAGHPGGTLSDAIALIHVQPKNQTVYVISIPRDVWVAIPVRSDANQFVKINEAYAAGVNDNMFPLRQPQFRGEHGGGNMSKEAVSKVVGMDIDYFAAVSFDSFKAIIDKLGEINVSVPVTFDDYFYPVKGRENETCGKSQEEIAELSRKLSGFQLEKQFECRYEHLHFDAGEQSMDGETALKFVRSRHSVSHGGDFARHQRQQAVLEGVRKKLISMDAVKNAEDLAEKFGKLITTDIELKDVSNLIEVFNGIGNYKVLNVYLNEENVFDSSRSSAGQFILVPKAGVGNFEKVHNYLNAQLKSKSSSTE